MLRFHLQNAVKSAFRMVGCEIRYAFQYPRITDRSIYSPWLEGNKVRTVLDVGANVGQSCTKFAAAFPNCTVHSFEPFNESYTRLADVANRSQGRIRAYPLACGDQESTIRAQYDPAAGSQLQRLDASAQAPMSENSQAIRVVTLDRWCAENGIDSVDILKTDTEGYDAKVLWGAQRLLSEGRVKCVVSEVGFLGDNHHSQMDAIYPFLSARGFAMAGIFEITYRRDRTCDFANAMFVHVGKAGEA
jgi:FkbM family methyltransferase